MTDSFCAYPGNRDEMIVACLYDDTASSERMVFEAHVAACEVCRLELASLRGVRRQLADWGPPSISHQSAVIGHQSSVISHQASVVSRQSSVIGHQPARISDQPADDQSAAGDQVVGGSPSWWRDVPVWAQAVAAVLVLGVAAGAANLNIHHDASGFTVRTGWMQPAQPAAAPADAQAPWHADLARLESDMRDELRRSNAHTEPAAMATPAVATAARSASDDELLRRMKAYVEESEKRQETELALRIAQLARDTHAERVADIANFSRALGMVQNNTRYEVASQREMLSSLATKVSQTAPAR
jgi:hypothetical protein